MKYGREFIAAFEAARETEEYWMIVVDGLRDKPENMEVEL